MDYDTLVDLTTELGYRLAVNGAETFRVEESITLILNAYGIDAQVFAIPNNLIVSIHPESGVPYTRMRRIGEHGNDLDAVERYSNLSRKICTERPDPRIAHAWLDEEIRFKRTHSHFMRAIGYAVTAGGFCLFFGGNIVDSLLACLCGVLIGATGTIMSKLKANQFFTSIVSAFFMGLLGYFWGAVGLSQRADTIIIGSIMLLVPGLLFTNAMRDIIYGDTNSGINRIVQVILISLALALGTAVAWGLVGAIWKTPVSIPGIHYPLLIQLIGTAVGCYGFAILFNVHGPGILLCVLGGVISWAVYYLSNELTGSYLLGYFWAGFAAALYAEIMARIRKFPAISYLVIAIFPMIPGGGTYYTMNHAVRGDMQAFASTGTEAIATAAVIAVGILIVSTSFRLWGNFKKYRIHKKSRI